jgi:hypothetical protein
MPKIADLEYTPNPNARKFVLKEPLSLQRNCSPSRM